MHNPVDYILWKIKPNSILNKIPGRRTDHYAGLRSCHCRKCSRISVLRKALF